MEKVPGHLLFTQKPNEINDRTFQIGIISVMAELQKNKGGSPKGANSKYSQEQAIRICTAIAEGKSLNSLIKTEGMPDISTVYRWIAEHQSFREMYTKAREDQADTLADEILHISDEEPMQVIRTEDGGTIERLDSAGINRNRLRVDARKWVASKLKPRKYGDRTTLAGDAENPMRLETVVEIKDVFAEILLNLELTKQDE